MAECEKKIEDLEAGIRNLEQRMATPEGASDMNLYEQHIRMKKELDDTVEEWEKASMELEELNS